MCFRKGLLNLGETSNVDPLASPIGKWLASINLPQYEQTFINFGYDNLDFLVSSIFYWMQMNYVGSMFFHMLSWKYSYFLQNGVLNEPDLQEMGVNSEEDRSKLLESIKELPAKIKDIRVSPVNNNNNNNNNTNNNNNNEAQEHCNEPQTVDEWLKLLELNCYADTFRKHLYTEMERVRNIWEVELTAVLEINKPGHRHRMMASLPDNGSQPTIQDINQELSHLVNNFPFFVGTYHHNSFSILI